MRKHLLAFLLATAAPVGAAQAWDIQCAQPLVIFGDNRPGPGMSTDVRVALDQDGKGWQVWHDLADGRIISRADQYAVNDLRNPAVAVGRLKQDTAWFGLLNGRPNLLMMGRLFDERGELIYLEELRDFRHDPSGILLMRTQADCGPDRDGRRWAAVARVSFTPPPQAATIEPPTPLAAPVQLAPPVAANSGDSVPILVANGGAKVAVTFADYPLPQTMIIDTGASAMSIPRSFAAELFSRGIATEDGTMKMCIADGTCADQVRFWISKITIGSRTFEHVEGVVAPDAAMMLLPFNVITATGSATIDTKNSRLIFGAK
jgi:Aspartyl protease